MLAVLSPAKSLDPTPAPATLPLSQPRFMKDASSLMRTTRGLSQKKIRELMSISADLAKLNYQRYRSFELPFESSNALPAALTFNGEVYRGLDARSLSEADLEWSQERIAILSGLFGLLRPLDLIQPYRLEMGTKLKTRRGSNLYAYWGDQIRKEIDRSLKAHTDPTLINLASNEYFKAVQSKRLKSAVVTCVFEDWKDSAKTPNVISFMAKHARGLMARYIVQQRVDQAAGLKDFALQRYKFQPKRSSDSHYIFGRKFVPVAG